ncbi:MAG: Poly-beta-1,6-N-acetyl-D-glucosamine N-deacetylase precursor [Microgenomates group bacterium ADurb.Bin219]|nr:MAG: Poly-beta-1,6-N-acetyl-D-glucosamine N-deacetylase precursor [Microgenomates group bacterium ADurb.Bin219]HNP89260.1 polysaccharide deacetylase family protein [Candidatus Woesebacteria bacterium]
MKFLLFLKKGFENFFQWFLILLVIVLFLAVLAYLIAALNLPFREETTVVTKGNLVRLNPTPTIFPPASPVPTQTPTPVPTLTPKEILKRMNEKYGQCRFVPILMYHHLLANDEAKAKGAQNLNVTPEIFESQVNYFINKGYQTIFLDELMDGLKGNRQLPAKPLIITFDDSYKELYYVLFPLMKIKNFKATVFVISQFLDGENYLSWSQLKEMASSNLLEVGGHGLNHLVLSEKSGEEFIRNQIVSSQKIINERSGRPVKVFAYPYGAYNATAEKVLREAGFTAAVRSSGGVNPVCAGLPYEIPRIRIGNAALSHFGL